MEAVQRCLVGGRNQVAHHGVSRVEVDIRDARHELRPADDPQQPVFPSGSTV
jgi:hypothetical protein